MEGFTFFCGHYEAIERMPEEQGYKMFNIICRYCYYGEEPDENSDWALLAAFEAMRHTLDVSVKKRVAGAIGGSEKGKNHAVKSELEECDFDGVPFDEIMELYNSSCSRIPSIRGIDGKRKNMTAKFFRHFGMVTIKEIFDLVGENDFLCGGGETGWKAKFDWILDLDNATKVLEGHYQPREAECRPIKKDEPRGFVGHAINIFSQNDQGWGGGDSHE